MRINSKKFLEAWLITNLQTTILDSKCKSSFLQHETLSVATVHPTAAIQLSKVKLYGVTGTRSVMVQFVVAPLQPSRAGWERPTVSTR